MDTRGERPLESQARRAWRARRRRMQSAKLNATPRGPRPPRLRPVERGADKIVIRALKLLGLHRRGTANARDLRHRSLAVTLARLAPAFEGYRILHLSDLHLDTLDSIEEAIVARIRGLKCDLVVMTGDYLTFHPWDATTIQAQFERILGATKPSDGVLAVLGNHDDVKVADLLQSLGVSVLANETLDLARGEDRLRVVGIDDPHRFYTPEAGALLARRHEGCSLVLAHTPEVADLAAGAGHDLYLCGHTHWGQVCLPGGTPIVTALHANRRLAQGVWRQGAMLGYTHAGCGVSRIPVRFFTRGEVVMLTLARGPAEIVETAAPGLTCGSEATGN